MARILGAAVSYRPRYLSHSAIELYARCPAAWARRYVQRAPEPPSAPMAFGKAFHAALEALHRGADAEVAWVRGYSTAQQAGELPAGSPTIDHGLALLALYRKRGVLAGEAEREFLEYLPDREAVPVPIKGIIDLVGPTALAEFKTSSRAWEQGQVDGSPQAALYAYAYRHLTGRKPEYVQFLVFSTRRVELQELRAYPAGPELRLFELRAAATWRGIRDQQFPPTCRQPYCAACVEAGVVPVRQGRGGSLELTL